MKTDYFSRAVSRPAHIIFVFAILPMTMSLTGCMSAFLNPPEEEAPPKPRIETRHLDVGETVDFVIPTTDEWEYSPYVAYFNDKLRIEIDESTPLPPDVIRYRIGDFQQTVTARNTEFVITRPGPIDFRIDPARLFGYGGEIKVVITRLR